GRSAIVTNPCAIRHGFAVRSTPARPVRSGRVPPRRWAPLREDPDGGRGDAGAGQSLGGGAPEGVLVVEEASSGRGPSSGSGKWAARGARRSGRSDRRALGENPSARSSNALPRVADPPGNPDSSSSTHDHPAVAVCAARKASNAGRSVSRTGTMTSVTRIDFIEN